MRRKSILVLMMVVLSTFLLGVVSTANAVNWIVPGSGPGTFPTIQDAIDSPFVIDWDIITVIGNPITPIVYSGAGFYNVDFKGKNVTVRTGDGTGLNGVPRTCIIDCQGQGRAFIFQSGETLPFAQLNGFIIRNGYAEDLNWPQNPSVDASGYGGAIYCKGSSPWIINCEIYDCKSDAGGGAIFCDENSDARILNCDIGLDYSSYNHAGVGFDKYIDPFDPCDVNLLDVNDLHQLGGGIYCRNSNPRIINCNISWNKVAGSGGGIACENSDALIRDCDIWENDCLAGDDRIYQHGGGIYFKGGTSAVRVERGTIMWNLARHSGGGIAVVDGNGVLIEDVKIIDNHSMARGGGIYGEGRSNQDANVPSWHIQNCLITNNVGAWSGGVSSSYGSVADIDNCTIAYNAAAWNYLPGGLECYYGDANVVNSIIRNNYGVQVSKVGSAALQACGDREHPYPVGDLNRDCHVDFRDFATMTRHWLECTAPECD